MIARTAPVGASAGAVICVASVSHGFDAEILLALLLSCAACAATWAAARRIAGGRYALGAAWIYALLPALGIVYVLAGFRHTFVHDELPILVGLAQPWRLAIGAAAVAVVAFAPPRAVAAAGVAAAVVALAVSGTGGLASVQGGIHESGWSTALLEWLFVAGTAGAAFRSPWLGVGAGGWVAAVVVAAADGGYEGGRFWGELATATPGIAILVTSIALLVPRLRPVRRPAAS
ncbi:MAG TPA: hypothetical protein VI408_11785 [Gaiellaceae bacterium]